MDLGHGLIVWVFVGALMLAASVGAGLLSNRLGMPLLLLFLGLGVMAGEGGLGFIVFHDLSSAFLIGSVALAVILFDGGLRTPLPLSRRGLAAAFGLATLGVAVTAGVVGLFAHYGLGFKLNKALLIGAIVASTDAAATFSLLQRQGIELKRRLQTALEVESGANDPMGVFLTVALVGMIAAGRGAPGLGEVQALVLQMGLGAALGLAGGWALGHLLNRVELAAGLVPILALAACFLVFAGTHLLGGSGFLAVYLVGVLLVIRRVRAVRLVGRFFDGLTWLAQIGMFLMLGLMLSPERLLPDLDKSVAIALVLMLVARPLAVAVCMAPLRFDANEILFAAWVGLRGAVPIYLALLPVMAGIDPSRSLFNVAFVVVAVSLALQGWTVPVLARWLGVKIPPDPHPPRLDMDFAGTLDRDLLAYRVVETARANGRSLAQLNLPRGTQIVSLVREGQVMSVESVDALGAGDIVIVFAKPEDFLRLDRLFARRAKLEEAVPLGDFALDGATSLAQLEAIYGIPVPAIDRERTLNELFHRKGKHPGIGDRYGLGPIALVAREVDADYQVRQVGVILDPDSTDRWRQSLRRLPFFDRRRRRRLAALNRRTDGGVPMPEKSD